MINGTRWNEYAKEKKIKIKLKLRRMKQGKKKMKKINKKRNDIIMKWRSKSKRIFFKFFNAIYIQKER